MSTSVLLCIGTRPEVIKMAPVFHALKETALEPIVLHTGQHEAGTEPDRQTVWPLYEFFGFLPAVQKIRSAQGRLEQRIALLRHVEAIRMHAATNGGKVPAKLADVDVPLPVDPFTGKPFRYEVIDGVAHVRGSPPKGDENNTAYNIHYEIIIRK
jgi:hypothetical protein